MQTLLPASCTNSTLVLTEQLQRAMPHPTPPFARSQHHMTNTVSTHLFSSVCVSHHPTRVRIQGARRRIQGACLSAPQYDTAEVLKRSLVPHLPGEFDLYLLDAGESFTV